MPLMPSQRLSLVGDLLSTVLAQGQRAKAR